MMQAELLRCGAAILSADSPGCGVRRHESVDFGDVTSRLDRKSDVSAALREAHKVGTLERLGFPEARTEVAVSRIWQNRHDDPFGNLSRQLKRGKHRSPSRLPH